MKLEVFLGLPDCAREVRQKVFIEEQGFKTEFDDKDEAAVHLVIFNESGKPVATCRIFEDAEKGVYILGRLAVIKEYRGHGLGTVLINGAERYVKEKGGKSIVLHAQQRVTRFYRKAGYIEFGEVEYDEGCPHIRMRKYL